MPGVIPQVTYTGKSWALCRIFSSRSMKANMPRRESSSSNRVTQIDFAGCLTFTMGSIFAPSRGHRKLSDGRAPFSSLAAVAIPGTVFGGVLYNMVEPICSWRIARHGLLEFRVGSALRLIYRDGRWSYVDIETKRSLMHGREPFT